MSNAFPKFSKINPETIENEIKTIISENLTKLDDLLKNNSNYTWANLMAPIDDMSDKLSHVWAPFSHIHSVMSSDKVREAYNKCIEILTEYHTEFMQNEELYKAIKFIADSKDFESLTDAQKKIIENDLRDFHLSGVDLNKKDKETFASLQQELSKLTTKFSENILDATKAWHLHIEDENLLDGLPEQSIELAKEIAKQKNLKGFIFTLHHSSFADVMKYLKNRELRKDMYEAFVTRASNDGPNKGKWDNTKIMEDILKLRHQTAELLGFKNYAEYSLKTKMAKTPDKVMDFLNELADKSKEYGKAEIKELAEFAKKTDGIDDLNAWDLGYYSEKLRQAKYDIDQEKLREYFPCKKVLRGMFEVLNKIYGINIKEKTDVDVWHPQVQFYEIFDKDNSLRGYLYMDLFARDDKREGAWMDECQVRRTLDDGSVQLPVAFLTCNFARPVAGKDALLTHDDVVTLFHESGHCLHHILTKVDYMSVSGINGVPWDAVEFPSQFLEFWCYEKEALNILSSHISDDKPLPQDLLEKIRNAKNFQSGYQMLRQIEFALFDFKMHLEYDPSKEYQVQSKLDEVRDKVSPFKPPAFNKFQHSFSHIFAGGYAAGYYSYKWAEVLSSDAFSKFEEKGVFDFATGQEFLHNILEKGGVYSPMELYVAFRGREPKIDALLKHSGIN